MTEASNGSAETRYSGAGVLPLNRRSHSQSDKPTAALRKLLAAESYVVTAPCHDALSAKLAEDAGFKVVWANGSAMEASLLGYPDMGLSTMSEVVAHAARITARVEVPLILDVDTGFGNALSVTRTVRECERAGVAGIHIEDQTSPKTLAHRGLRQLLPRAEAVGKIQAALEARNDEDFIVIARCEGDAVSISELIDRCNLYLEAGADLVFPILIYVDGVPRSQIPPDDLMQTYKRIAEEIEGPAFAMSVSMPKGYSAFDMGELGFKLVSHGGSSLYAGLYAMRAALADAYKHGTMEGYFERLNELTQGDGDDSFRADPFMAVEHLLGIDECEYILRKFARPPTENGI